MLRWDRFRFSADDFHPANRVSTLPSLVSSKLSGEHMDFLPVSNTNQSQGFSLDYRGLSGELAVADWDPST